MGKIFSKWLCCSCANNAASTLQNSIEMSAVTAGGGQKSDNFDDSDNVMIPSEAPPQPTAVEGGRHHEDNNDIEMEELQRNHEYDMWRRRHQKTYVHDV